MARTKKGRWMTREEWAIAWHDWLRGVSLVGLGAVLAGLYFLKWIPHDVFPLIMGLATLVVVMGFVLEHCLCSLVPAWMRLVTLLLLLASGAGLVTAIFVETTPGMVVTEGKLSPSHPTLEGYVPATGDVLVNVVATPGVFARGDDGQIAAKVRITFRSALDGSAKEVREKWAFTNHAANQGKKGGGSAVTSVQMHLEDASEGGFQVVLESMEPPHAKPLEVKASIATFPAGVLRLVLAALAILALLLAPYYTRRSAFPAFVPGATVLGAAGVGVLTGLPPDSPAPKLLGILVAGAFGGAAVGYLLAKGVQRLFPSRLAVEARLKGKNPPEGMSVKKPGEK